MKTEDVTVDETGSKRGWLKKLAWLAPLFFLIKGLAWLAIPALYAVYGME